MQIMLHAGLHKSGTTTLQSLLGKFFGEPATGVDWYPPTVKHGPGHADAVWSLLGSHGRESERRSLDEIIRVAEVNNVARILLSSEEFMIAWPSRLSLLAELLREHQIELIFTATSHLHRAISFWKEMVKHGSDLTLEDSFILQLARFSPRIINDFITQIRPARASLVTVDPNAEPIELIHTFWRAANLDASTLRYVDDSSTRLNASFGAIETELIRTLNSMLPNNNHAMTPLASQYLMNGVFQGSEWQHCCPRIETRVAARWIDVFQRLSDATRDCILPLAKSGALAVFGSLDRL